MYDQHIIYPGSLRNMDGEGWSIGARLPYYRGQPLSIVEDIILTIDGATVPREQVRFSVRGKTWSLDQLDDCTAERWEFGEVATVTAVGQQGLAAGEHQVGVAVQLRISYLPWSPTTSCTRTETLAG
ncbi:C-glycoside deglycosidase beta subunit domain-containing protein [Massilia sp. LjRoot122]|uniref:C-glycoside deglycosidase beta subunit domain-containing protein n=1 Tax=Massilia sp. LjRoot122 TaxID=3342257 RepID=UPI003ED110D5